MAITKSVIIASETEIVRARFAAALVEAGHAVETVASAAELLDRVGAETARTDLVVLDLRLHGRSGVALIDAIRSIARPAIVIFSGSVAGASQVRQLAALGLFEYVNEHSAPERILPALAPHLFPGNFDRRGSARLLLGIPIAIDAAAAITAAITLNLGRGGVGVRTLDLLEAGAHVAVRFRLPGSPRDIAAVGRIRWSDRRLGMGLQFEQLEAGDQEAIDGFIDGGSNRF